MSRNKSSSGEARWTKKKTGSKSYMCITICLSEEPKHNEQALALSIFITGIKIEDDLLI